MVPVTRRRRRQLPPPDAVQRGLVSPPRPPSVCVLAVADGVIVVAAVDVGVRAIDDTFSLGAINK